MKIAITFAPPVKFTASFKPMKRLKTYEVFCTSGRRHFCNAEFSFLALIRVQQLGEIVSAWQPSENVPVNTTVLQ